MFAGFLVLLAPAALFAQSDDQAIGDKPLTPGSLEALPVDVQTLLRLTNVDREAAGLPPVRWDAHLGAAARAHVTRLAEEATLEHQFEGEPDLPTRAAQAGAHFSVISENIAYAGGPEAVERQWMSSPGHRANILDPRVDAVGIATALVRGTLYAVEDFAKTVTSLSPDEVEARVVQELAAVDRHGNAPLVLQADPVEARTICAGQTPASSPAKPPFATVWQGPELTLPEAVAREAASPGYHEALVGACPAKTAIDPGFTAYRIAVLLR